MIQRIIFSAVLGAVVAASAFAAPVTIVDTTPTSADNDGTIGAGEYAGYSVGINSGFGNAIGSESQLHIDSSLGGGLNFGLVRGSGVLNDDAVIYIDSVAGGFTDTTTMSDTADTLRSAISGNADEGDPDSELVFAPTFAADYAIAFNGDGAGFGGLWGLAAGGNNSLNFIKSVNLTPTVVGFPSASPSVEMNLDLADIGVAAGGSFRYVVTYMNADDFGLFRSNEFHGVSQTTVAGGNPGRNNVTLAAGDFNTFQSYAIPEPGSLSLAALGLMGLMRRRRVPTAE
jgi:hypothetical protein